MITSVPAEKVRRIDPGLILSDVNDKRLIIVLEGCSLESAKVGKEHVILCSDKHASFLRSRKKDPAKYRPDILHQSLLMLLDSPLNRAGLLQVYIHTDSGVLIEVNPQTRIPRTFDRFCGLMVQLLHKLTIRADNSSTKLLKIIRNPVSSHFPPGCRKIITSFHANKFVKCNQIVEPGDKKPIVIAVGGFASGKINVDYAEEEIKISEFPLSAALTCAKLTSGFEDVWGVELSV